MTRCHPLAVLLPLAVLVLIPACGRRAADEANTAAVVVVQDPANPPAGTLAVAPPPRELELAAEPDDSKDAMEVYIHVVSEGYLKVHYPDGSRVPIGGNPEKMTEYERQMIGKLMLPVGRPVRFVGTSYHDATSFQILRFGLSLDVAPERWSQVTVKPTRVGEFPVRIGRERVGDALVVSAEEFEKWRAELALPPPIVQEDLTPAQAGQQLFLKLQCIKCHSAGEQGAAPVLEGLFGTKVKLKDGTVVTADAEYIKQSILKPRAKVVEGWEPVMPPYEGHVTDQDLDALVAYIRSLKPGNTPKRTEEMPPVGAPTERSEKKDVPVAPPPREKR